MHANIMITERNHSALSLGHYHLCLSNFPRNKCALKDYNVMTAELKRQITLPTVIACDKRIIITNR